MLVNSALVRTFQRTLGEDQKPSSCARSLTVPMKLGIIEMKVVVRSRDPHSGVSMLWDGTQVLLLIWVAFSVTLNLAFNVPEHKPWTTWYGL